MLNWPTEALSHTLVGGGAFRLLGRPGFEVCDIAEASAALGASAMKVEAALDRLVDLRLADWGEHDTYRLPPLLRLFATELGAEVPRRRSVTELFLSSRR